MHENKGDQKLNSEFLNRPLDTKNSITTRPRKTSRHTIRGIQKSNSEFLNGPLDTKNSITKRACVRVRVRACVRV